MSLPDSNKRKESDPYKRCMWMLATITLLCAAILVIMVFKL